jgi:exopolysaccharide biosynthesis protein
MKSNSPKKVWRILLGVLLTCVIGAAFMYTAGYIIIHGPSAHAKELFVRTLADTMTLDRIPKLYLSEEEIKSIVKPDEEMVSQSSSGDDLPVEVSSVSSAAIAETVAARGEEDMIELIDVSGTNWKGKMLLVHNPKLVTLAAPDKYESGSFRQIPEFVEEYNAVAGITATGFTKKMKPYGYVSKEGKII